MSFRLGLFRNKKMVPRHLAGRQKADTLCWPVVERGREPWNGLKVS